MAMIGVILSGGQSSRMGGDKAALSLTGQNFLARITAELAPLFDELYVSVDRPGRYPGCRELVDLRPGGGPLAGLEAAFLRTGAEAVFLAAVDLPFADRTLAASIIAKGRHGDACAIRRSSGAAEPLFALYRCGCLPALTACLEQGCRAARTLLERVDCRWLEESQLPGFCLERALWNVNTREDLRQAAEWMGEK